MEDEMWASMKKQFEEDRVNLQAGNAISLLAKWIKTADASSERTRKLGILTAQKLGYSVYEFKRLVRAMRKHIGVVETLMSAGRWDEIRYSAVPSRAMMIYRNAFMKHDRERYSAFVQKAVSGAEKIHSATLFPYDIVEKIMNMSWAGFHIVDNDVLEAQWRQLPDYVEAGTNALVIADTSGSMYGRPMATSVCREKHRTLPQHVHVLLRNIQNPGAQGRDPGAEDPQHQHERLGRQHESAGGFRARAGDRCEEPCRTEGYDEVTGCHLRYGDRSLR